MLTRFSALLGLSALLVFPAAAQMNRFVGTVEDTFRGSLLFEIESPLRDGEWLHAGEVESSGSRSTQVAPVEGGWEVRVTTNRWKHAKDSAVTETVTVPEIESEGAPEGVVAARRRLAAFERRLAGGSLCGIVAVLGSPCPEIGQFLPLPELPWVVTAVNGSTIKLEAAAPPPFMGLPLSSLTASVEQIGDSLRWWVRGQGEDAASPVTVTGTDGSPGVVEVPMRVTLSLEGSSATRPAG